MSPVDVSSNVLKRNSASAVADLTHEISPENASQKNALLSAEQKAPELQNELREGESAALKLRHDAQERFVDIESSASAVSRSSEQRPGENTEAPAMVGQLQLLTNGLTHLLSSISSTESRVRVELLKQDQASVFAEQELAQALAEIVMLQRRNADLEHELEKTRGKSDGGIDGYAVRSSKFTPREKELESAVLELKNEVADRDRCILCLMGQMNEAAASHEEAVPHPQPSHAIDYNFHTGSSFNHSAPSAEKSKC
jgi:hypothetical protein